MARSPFGTLDDDFDELDIDMPLGDLLDFLDWMEVEWPEIDIDVWYH